MKHIFLFLKKGILTFLKMLYVVLVSIAFSAFADRPRYLKYDPSALGGPYVYGDVDYGGISKSNMQSELLVMTDEPREFLRVFDYFVQFGSPVALDINYISTDKYKDSYLIRTIILRDWALVNPLIDRGININWQDSYRGTALIAAAVCGHLQTVERLLLAGANPFLADKDGDTALDNARIGQQKSTCPEGDYDGVIALLEDIHEEQQQVTERGSDKLPNRFPEESNLNNPKYGAIAHKTDNPLIFVWNLGYSSRDEARNDVVSKCNNVNTQGRETGFSSCEFLVSFPTGRCVAYMVSSQEDEEALYESEGHHIIMAWGVGNSKRQAMDEALRKCDRPALKNECKVLISECQH